MINSAARILKLVQNALLPVGQKCRLGQHPFLFHTGTLYDRSLVLLRGHHGVSYREYNIGVSSTLLSTAVTVPPPRYGNLVREDDKFHDAIDKACGKQIEDRDVLESY